MSSAKRKVSVYKALINSDKYEDILEPFQRVVESILFEMRAETFTVEGLREGILKKWNIDVPPMPLRTILGRIISQNAIEKYPNLAKYRILNRTIMEKTANEMQERSREIKDDWESVISDFIEFTKKVYNVVLNNGEAISAVDNFLSRYASEISVGDIVSPDSTNLYFATYILEKGRTDDRFSELFKSITLGYVLAETLFVSEEPEKSSLSSLKVVLDTPILFRLLGINQVNEKDIYLNMLEQMKKANIEICTFDHCIEEMEQIIDGSLFWIEKNDFNATMASETSLYYLEKGYSKADIQEDRILLRKRIKEMGIEPIGDLYIQQNYQFLQDENRILEAIVDVYKEKNTFFREEDNKQTIEIDAKSINHIYVLRSGMKAMDLSSCNAIFLTTNNSLAYASKRFNNSIYTGKHNLISPCIKDVLFGTYLWLDHPVNLREMAINQLIHHAYSIMMPAPQLWEKYVQELKICCEKGDISEEQAYMLRTDGFARKSLVKITRKEMDNLSAETPLQIMQAIKDEGKEEMRAIKDAEKLELEKGKNSEIDELKKSVSDTKMTLDKIKENYIEAVNDKDEVTKRLNKQDELLMRACKGAIQRKLLWFHIGIALLASGILIFIIWIHFWKSDNLDLPSLVFSVFAWIAGGVSFFFVGKKNKEDEFKAYVYNYFKGKIERSTRKKFGIVGEDKE